MKWHLPLFVALVFNVYSLNAQGSIRNIMAYYMPNEQYAPEVLPLGRLTHIILSFAVIVDGEMQFTNTRNDDFLKRLVTLRNEKYTNLKVMIACGGWGADGFSDVAYNDSSRIRFIRSVESFIKYYDLDGLDMDWVSSHTRSRHQSQGRR